MQVADFLMWAQLPDFDALLKQLMIVFIILGVVLVFQLICMGVVYAKAGQPGWAVIVPIYQLIVWCQIAGRPTWHVIWYMFCPPAALILGIIDTIEIAHRFGKGTGFALGLLFLGIIFWPLLAFSDARYRAPSPSSRDHDEDEDRPRPRR
jgi:hypothetical protein